jgi:filamentous hemagglutinin family protein
VKSIAQSTFLVLSICTQNLCAQPSNMEVVHGNANYQSEGNHLSIECSDKAILHWDSFSIQAAEKVEFVQPSVDSSVLNRVTGNEVSQLLGQLCANGSVYLINPNGIFIGPDAKIVAAVFAASTLDVLNEDFLKGKELLFEGVSNEILENHGSVQGLNGVFFIAKKILNEGDISSNETAALAAAEKVLYQPHKNQKIFVDLGEEQEGQIWQNGKIQALAVEIRANGAYEKAIQTKGSIESLTLSESENGKIIISAMNSINTFSGEIIAPGKEVQITGDKILLTETALIDVSGETTGSIYIGGGFQGKNPEIPNAQYTYLEPQASLKADGLNEADGGNIIVWSDGSTVNYGTLSAKGGTISGDGGLIEVSGKKGMFFPVTNADLSVTKGSRGNLLLDPDSITISTGAGAAVMNYNFGDAPASLTLNDTDINTFMNSPGGGTGTDLTLQANLSISMDAGTAIAVTEPANLTIQAGGAFSMTATSSISLTTGDVDITTNDPGGTGVAQALVVLNDISTTGGDISVVWDLTGNSGTGVGTEILTGATIDAGGGNITITGDRTDIGGLLPGVFIRDQTTFATSGSGTISITGSQSINDGQNGIFVISTGGAPTFTVENGNIEFTGTKTNANFGAGMQIAGAIMTCTGTGNIILDGNGSGNNDDVRGIEIVVNTDMNLNGGNVNITGSATGGAGTNKNGLFVGGVDLTIDNANLATFTCTSGGTGTNARPVRLETGSNIIGTNGTSFLFDCEVTGTGINSQAISMPNSNIQTDGNGTITMNLISGSGDNSFGINPQGGTISTVNGNIFIENTAQGDNFGHNLFGSAVISSQNGNITIEGTSSGSVSESIILTFVTIQTTTSGSVTLTSNRLDYTSNFATVSAAGSGNVNITTPRDISIFNRSITRTTGTGNVNITAGADIGITGADGVATDTTISATGTGNINFIAGTDIAITGGTGAGDDTVVSAIGGAINMTAGENFAITEPGTGLASLSTGAGGNITIITDNNAPTIPDIGTGGFTISGGSTITTAGELRIYTALPGQNTASGETINTAVFTPGTFGVDNDYEQFGIYSPGGTYIGPEFNFYYKRPLPQSFMDGLDILVIDEIYSLQVALAQLSDLLSPNGPYQYRYIPTYCDQDGDKRICSLDVYNEYVHWHYSWNK